MTAYLFDVNVLLAMFDTEHEHHQAARHWWAAREADEWCTCPITENGFLRIASSDGYPQIIEQLPDLIEIFRNLCHAPDHLYWPANIFLSNVVPKNAQLTSSKTTDIYLLAPAIEHGGKLATFDTRIPAHVLPGGVDALEVIVP